MASELSLSLFFSLIHTVLYIEMYDSLIDQILCRSSEQHRQVRREQTALALCYSVELSEFQGTQVLLGVVQFYNHMYYYMYNY